MRESDVLAHVLPSTGEREDMVEIEIVGDGIAAEIAAAVSVNEDRVEIDWLYVGTEGSCTLTSVVFSTIEPFPVLAVAQKNLDLLALLADLFPRHSKGATDLAGGHSVERQLVDQIPAQAKAERLDLRPVIRGVHNPGDY